MVQFQKGVIIVTLHYFLFEECLPILNLPHSKIAFEYLRKKFGVAEIDLVLPVSSLEKASSTADSDPSFDLRIIIELRLFDVTQYHLFYFSCFLLPFLLYFRVNYLSMLLW